MVEIVHHVEPNDCIWCITKVSIILTNLQTFSHFLSTTLKTLLSYQNISTHIVQC